MASIRIGEHVCEVTELPDVESLKNNLPSGIVHQIEKRFMDDTETGSILATIFVIARSQFKDITFDQMDDIPWGEVEKFTTGLADLSDAEPDASPPDQPADEPVTQITPETPATPADSGALDSSPETSAT
jgi:hypothetical protein